MQIINAKCNNCGAELSFDSDKTMLFCPYCGTKLLIVDGDEVKAAKIKYSALRDVELAREETKRERNRQEHERETEMIKKGDNVRIEIERLKAEQIKEKERQKNEIQMQKLQYKQEREERNLAAWEKSTRVVVVLFIAFFLLMVMVMVMAHDSSSTKRYAVTPESSKDCVGMPYELVQQQFRDAGFTSVRSEAVPDLSDWWILKDTDKVGTVKEISVNGELSFKKDESYSRFAPVVIYYHIYPQ